MVNFDGPMAYLSGISNSKPGLKKGKEKGSKFMGIISSSFFHLLVDWYHAMTRIEDLEIFERVALDRILETLPFALDFKKCKQTYINNHANICFTLHYSKNCTRIFIPSSTSRHSYFFEQQKIVPLSAQRSTDEKLKINC
jgi:hypothetical protein